MKLIGNLIWFLAYGFWMALIHFAVGLVLCISVIGIPFGLQFFKIARYALWPFTASMGTDFDRHPIANIIWIIFGGAELAFGHLFVGILLCITIVGIPFGKKCFKLAALSLMPFGATVAL